MERSLQEQFFSSIEKAERILIALPKLLSVDTQATAEALRLFLAGLGKQVTVASSGQPLKTLGFLHQPAEISSEVASTGPLVIAINTKRAKLNELRYEVVGDALEIIVTAKDGAFRPDEVSVGQKSEANFDLIIVLAAASLDQLAELFSNQTDLFYNTPKVAISTDSAHEYFGAANIVDVTLSSAAEVVAQLFVESKQSIDAEIATALLAGIIAATASFQDVRTTPKTFALAAQLVELGARQQDIIINLFKSRDFALLKLWGRLLARVKTVNHTLLYSTLPAQDFEKTATGPDHVLPVFWELLDNVSGYQSLGLLAETAPGVLQLILATLPHVSRENILKVFPNAQVVDEAPHSVYRLTRVIISGMDMLTAENALQSAIS